MITLSTARPLLVAATFAASLALACVAPHLVEAATPAPAGATDPVAVEAQACIARGGRSPAACEQEAEGKALIHDAETALLTERTRAGLDELALGDAAPAPGRPAARLE